jgi:tripartite ATP-independent transporter DctP family solute receptor
MTGRRGFLRRAAWLAAGAATTGAPAGARAQQGKLLVKAAAVDPLGHPSVEAIVRMGRKLEAATNGRLNMQIYPEMQLGTEKETLEKAQAGALQLCRVSAAAAGAIVDELNVFTLPYLFRDEAHLRNVIDGPIGRDLLDGITGAPASRLIGLGWMDAGTRNVYATRPIRTPADLKGQKIRTIDHPIVAETMSALGGHAVPVDVDEISTALQSGAVDGVEASPPSFRAQDHARIARFYSLTNHLTIPEVFVFSRRSWEWLTTDDQALVRTLSREAQLEQRRGWDTLVADSVTTLKAAGVQFVDADRRAFSEATRPVRDRYGVKWKALMTRIAEAR